MRTPARFVFALVVVARLALTCPGDTPIRICPTCGSFVRGEEVFVPWGFNYDHNAEGRLLESYWHDRWDEVMDDLKEIRSMGATVVRIHLQFGLFFPERNRPNEKNLRQLRRLLRAAEELGLHLNITGLGCYLKEDIPSWYDALSRVDRWRAQADFWRTIALVCRESPAVFCYDLMNEPVVAGPRGRDSWLGPPFAGRYHFVQFIAKRAAKGERAELAVAWIRQLRTAIRSVDESHLITVGLVPWSLPGGSLTSGFDPAIVGPELDFLSVHIYPQTGRLEDSKRIIDGFAEAKRPLIVEETFPLRCSPEELAQFIDACPNVDGWLSFYWGELPSEPAARQSIKDAITRQWIQAFSSKMRVWARREAARRHRTCRGGGHKVKME